MRISDWSSDVCSSDLRFDQRRLRVAEVEHAAQMRQQRVVDDGDEPPHEKKARQQRQRRRVALRRADRRAPAIYGDTGWNGHERLDRKRVVEGRSVAVRVDLGGGRIIQKKQKT